MAGGTFEHSQGFVLTYRCGGISISINTLRSDASRRTSIQSLAANTATEAPVEPRARAALFLAPGEGRTYPMGRISALFKADGSETAGGYSISEWWLEPHTQGPGAHSHPEDDVFYVLEGVMSFLVDGRWLDAPKGSFVLVPGGATHDFENRGPASAGMLNFSAPGNFEEDMPGIVEWFANHPPGHAGG